MKRLSIRIACPAPPGSRYGNRITATRWSRMLRELGHSVHVVGPHAGEAGMSTDLLIALHAKHTAAATHAFREAFARRPIIVALTGTDLYRDIHNTKAAQRSLEIADRLIVLHDRCLDELSAQQRRKARVIYQSAAPTNVKRPLRPRSFRALVIGHLRHEKDPFRAALAVRHLPASSRIQIEHYGAARRPQMAAVAQREMNRNRRYQWFGERPRWQVRRHLARSQLLILSSRIEGGASVLSEALADEVPIVASRIPGCEGMLGEDYAGLFPVGNTRCLRDMLLRAETDQHFIRQLRQQCKRRAKLITPQREISSWKKLVAEFA